MRKEWYCEVCGSIKDQNDTELCPNCGMNTEYLIPFSIDEHTLDDTSKIVIIGNGVAGFSAAKTLRTLHAKCSITMITKSTHTPFNYIKLSKDNFLERDTSTNIDTTWYKQHHVTLHSHVEITHIDTQSHEIHSQQQRFPYDILILAMGCERILPQIPGNDLKHIYTIDALYDTHVVDKIIRPERHGVIIGSDISCIELACALADAHIQIDIIEQLPHLMPLELNTIGSELLSTYLKSQKIQLHINQPIKKFHGTSNVESIEFDNGKCINADFVIISGSKKANLSLLKHSDIHYDKRVLIDQHMQTNNKDIYACGGVSHTYHSSENCYLNARKQGMLAALHILGIHSFLPQYISPRYFKHEEFSIFLLGDIHHYDQHIEIFDELHKTYEKYCYNDDQCSGVLLINSDTQITPSIKHYNEKCSFSSKR